MKDVKTNSTSPRLVAINVEKKIILYINSSGVTKELTVPVICKVGLQCIPCSSSQIHHQLLGARERVIYLDHN